MSKKVDEIYRRGLIALRQSYEKGAPNKSMFKEEHPEVGCRHRFNTSCGTFLSKGRNSSVQ
jgi:hypothetical protein